MPHAIQLADYAPPGDGVTAATVAFARAFTAAAEAGGGALPSDTRRAPTAATHTPS